MDLRDQCRPMATKMVLYMLVRAADHYGTIRWPLHHNFSKLVVADHRQSQMDHQQCAGLVHTKTICMART